MLEICRAIAVDAKMTVSATTIMLKHLRERFPDLPKDCRTLMRTTRKSNSITIAGGDYIHLGLVDAIEKAIGDRIVDSSKALVLQLAIDGISPFRSSRKQLWPILGRLVEPLSSVFLIGVFCGLSKPKNINQFLTPLVNDLKQAQSNGILLTTQNITVGVILDSIICDAPARAWIKQVKSHSGYSCCDRCTIVGVHNGHKVIFPYGDYSKRTDVDFRSRRDEDHHIGDSPLEYIQFDMIKGFPLDYMHLVCLGFCKRMLNLWRSGPISGKVRLSAVDLRRLSDGLDKIRPYLPFEFQRKCRSLDDFERWKATEFRQFLLYLGPVVLRGILDEKKYENFLNFSICFYISCHPLRASMYAEFVGKMLLELMNQFASLYGENELVYNMHCLSHIWEDVKLRGHLDQYSAFPFESYMGKLRRMVRSSTMPASQIVRRIKERQEAGCSDVSLHFDDTLNGITRLNSVEKYIKHDRLILSAQRPDNAVIVNGQPAWIVDSKSDMVKILRFSRNEEFFERCVSSKDLFIFKCSVPSRSQWIPVNMVDCKCVSIPNRDEFVFIHCCIHGTRAGNHHFSLTIS